MTLFKAGLMIGAIAAASTSYAKAPHSHSYDYADIEVGYSDGDFGGGAYREVSAVFTIYDNTYITVGNRAFYGSSNESFDAFDDKLTTSEIYFGVGYFESIYEKTDGFIELTLTEGDVGASGLEVDADMRDLTAGIRTSYYDGYELSLSATYSTGDLEYDLFLSGEARMMLINDFSVAATVDLASNNNSLGANLRYHF